jgi:hypothetical protein
MELKDKSPNICSVWDTMDSFDGLFLEEDLDKVNNDMTPSELETELDFLVENVSSAHQSSKESDPYFLEIGKIKGRISEAILVEDHKDDNKVSNDNVK